MPALSHDRPTPVPPPDASSPGGCLVALDGRALPLRHTTLRAEARGGVCRTVVVQRFENPYDEPLEVTYQLPLPADGAVSGFRFTLGQTTVVGEVDRKQAARERFEEALVQGRTAALLEQVRSSVFTQRVGNLPPRADLVAEVTVDQRLAWLAEGAWEWRFPTVVGARYMGAAGRVPDADALRVEAAEGALPNRLSLDLAVRDDVASGHRPESPSHPLAVATDGGAARVSLRDDGVRLDRDVVVRWPVARPEVGLAVTTARAEGDADAQYALLTIVPPSREARAARVARDLVVLLDTSGSMGGRPLDQAKRVVAALIDTLDDGDRLELVEFSSTPRRWQPEPVAATPGNRRRALDWLGALQAGGGTEMHAAVLEALRPLRPGAQRQVVLVTDGYIGFERQIVETVLHELPGACRLHTVGVGSAVNRSLTTPAARAGRGIEVVIGLDEDPERAARRLVARTHAPVVTELAVEGDAVLACAPSALPDLFEGAPVLVAVKLRPGATAVRVRGATARGPWMQTVAVPAAAPGDGHHGVRALYGREAVEDQETLLAAGGAASEVDATIERLGLDFQLATRLTSWIAVTRERTVDPTAPRRAATQPQEVPYGTSIEGLGLRAAVPGAPVAPAGYLTPASAVVTGAFAALPMQAAPAPSFGGAPKLLQDERVYSPASYPLQSGPVAPLPTRRARPSWLAVLVALVVLAALAVLAWRLLAPRRDPPRRPAATLALPRATGRG